MELEEEGGWPIHQSWSRSNCKRSTASIDFSLVPDSSQELELWFKYLAGFLRPTRVYSQQLNAMELEEEEGWQIHQSWSRPNCKRSTASIDFSLVTDSSKELELWDKYLAGFLRPTRVNSQQLKFMELEEEGDGKSTSPGPDQTVRDLQQ